MNDTMIDPPGADSAPPPPPPPGSSNPFVGYRRSSTDRWFAGVAGGLARQFGIDVRIVRLVGIGLAIAGIGVPAYLLAWLVLPADDRPSVAEEKGWNRTTVAVIGLLIVIVGFSVGGGVGDHPGRVIPWLIVAFGVWLVVRPHDHRAPLFGPPRPFDAPHGAVFDTDSTRAATVDPTIEQPASNFAPTAPSTSIAAPAPRWRGTPRPRPFLTPLALAVAVIVAGTALLVGHGRWTHPGTVGAFALLAFGAALVCSAFVGRARGLIAIGVLIAVPVMIGTAVDGRWGDWRSEWTSTPRSSDTLQDRYQRGFGESRLDLSNIELGAGESRTVDFEQLAGDVTIVMPPNATVDIDAKVAAGDIVIESTSGSRIERSGTDSSMNRTVVTGDGSTHLTLDLHLWAGRLRVLKTTESAAESPAPSVTTPVAPIPSIPTPSIPTTLEGPR